MPYIANRTRFIPVFFILLSVMLLLMISACTVNELVRDELELYQAGLDFWQQGHYEMAIKVLTPFLEKDSLYTPLYTVLADSYYRTNRETEALLLLERASRIQDSGIIENLRFTFKALENRVVSHEERVNFQQYITDVANRHALDRALILAMIREGSSFSLEGNVDSDALGIMGLSRDLALAAGLKVAEHERLDGIDPFDSDERLDPVRSIYHSVRYLSSLIEENRTGTRTVNLLGAIRAYYATGRDSTETVDHIVSTVIDYYRYYRHNIPNKEEAFRQYDEVNSHTQSQFTSHHYEIPDIEHNVALNAYKESRLYIHLYLPDPIHQAYYYSNLALLSDMLDDTENAELLYEEALRLAPGELAIAFNYAIFHFGAGNYREAYTLLNNIPVESALYNDALIVRCYSLLLLNELHTLSRLVKSNGENIKSDPHLQNLQGLYYFKINDLESAVDYFYRAYEATDDPVYASNFLASYYQYVFPRWSFAELTEITKITRKHDTGFIWPVDLRYISSRWGWRPNPFGRNWAARIEGMSFHNGIDIPGMTGTPIRSSAAGEVIVSTNYRLGGESIFIQHPENYITTYLHLDKRLVEEGETVQQGQIIGLLGNTGQSTGPHLHFGMFDSNNQPANPLNYLPVY